MQAVSAPSDAAPPRTTPPARPELRYLLILALAALGAWLYVIRAQSLFACQATKYDADLFLAYCHADHYGDYEHGAFWYGLEPVADPLNRASVLFLGSSRMQFGFSGEATREFFREADTGFYLMGFSYWENSLFEGPLLEKLHASPRAYVINLDTFFEDKASAPAAAIFHEPEAESRYREKERLQARHSRICGRLPLLCGHDQAFFRSRSTGQYTLQGGRFADYPVSYDDTPDEALIAHYVERARPFLAQLGVPPACVIFTMVPTVGTPSASATAIANRLGSPLIAPRIDGLKTFDQSHLQPESAERWSRAFFALAGPRIRNCLAAGDAQLAMDVR